MSLKDELEKRVRRGAKLSADLERLRGRKEQLQSELEEHEATCRKKGYEPSELADNLKRLVGEFNTQLAEADASLDSFEQALKPFLQEI